MRQDAASSAAPAAAQLEKPAAAQPAPVQRAPSLLRELREWGLLALALGAILWAGRMSERFERMVEAQARSEVKLSNVADNVTRLCTTVNVPGGCSR